MVGRGAGGEGFITSVVGPRIGHRRSSMSRSSGVRTTAASVCAWTFAVVLSWAWVCPAPAAAKPVLVDAIVNQRWTGDFNAMMRRRLMRVLVVNSKTLYYIDRGQPRGIVYEAFKEFEKEVNRKLKKGQRPLHVVFIPTPRDELLSRIADGRGDVSAGGLTITAQRRKLVDFTSPTFTGVDEIVVTGPESPPLSTVDDLAGREVFVRKSSSYYGSLVELNRELRREGKAEVVLRPAPEELEDEDLLEMVNAGLVAFVVVDKYKAEFWAQVFDGLRLHPEATVKRGSDLAWAIRKGSPQLKAKLNAFIKTHGTGTTFGNVLMSRYLKSAEYVKNATAEREMRKYRAVVRFFEKYGNQYGLDPLLLMAQGYQESRLDQSVRSRAGAIGVMQVMPPTGKEMGVGDIRKLEPNIHAGVKYIRFMENQYYAKERMDPVNKTLFAFASYNAGPAKIQKARATAKRRGMDPNRWFYNVALVVGEQIGREPVQYVSNIYKYYIAYKLVSESLQAKEAAMKSLNGG
jgi:membrane-bound lytic murein transglycosylase MltF